jgi:hypothetical protein
MKKLCNDLALGSMTEGSYALLSHDRFKDAISLLDGSYVMNPAYRDERLPYTPLTNHWGSQSSASTSDTMGESVMRPPDIKRVKRALDDVGLVFNIAVESQQDRDAKKRKLKGLSQSRLAPRPDYYVLVLKSRQMNRF